MSQPRSGGPTSPPPSGAAPEGDKAIEAPPARGDHGGAAAGEDAAHVRTVVPPTETDPIAVSQIRDALKELSRARAPQAHVLLLVYHRQGAETVRLSEGVGVVVGRDPSADVAIPERSLSRRHARFTLQRGDVLVEDLGSTNGTFLGGQRVERGVLKPGEEVMLGEITASLRVLASAEIPVLNLDALDALRGAVEWARGAGEERGSVPTPAVGLPAPEDGGIVMRSPAMRPILETAMRLARSIAPVLLQGETGTGKDMLARLIHEAGPRHRKPLMCVSCSGVPAQLLESTLFGHEAGAFPGAMQPEEGVLEQASGGTVLLDEVGDLPASAQAALLRVLETRRVVRLGSAKEIDVDVRILATTHRDLEAMCDAGTFRSDLLYRLNSVPFRIPPLCERREDIGPLATRFLQHANEVHKRKVQGIDPDAIGLLEAYPWPGNVRELRNVIERAVLGAPGEMITAADLPDAIRTGSAIRRTPAPDRPDPEPVAAAAAPSRPAPGPAPSAPPMGLKAQMDRLEAEIILEALRATAGNLAKAAQRLRMPLRTLQEKMTVHGLKRADYRDGAPPSRSK
jgi:DNA-binding NtrC family response regulator